MARLIALEWDVREARVAVGSSRGTEIVVEQAFAVPWAEEAEDESRPADQGRQLANALAAHGISNTDVLVGLGRASIELRMLTLPATPPEERPDLVRFQAMQAFTNIGEDWPVDFVEIDQKENEVNILATAISPDLVEQVKRVCEPATLNPARVLLRPFATVSLLRRNQQLDQCETCLVVDLLSEEADLTVTSDGQVVFIRTIRLPNQADPAARAQMLVGELKRTIGAAQNQLGGSRVGRVVICGDPNEHSVLTNAVGSRLSLDVALFNPLDGVRLGRDLKRSPPDNPGRFTPLFGMLADEAAGSLHAIDYLNPRKRPDPPNNTRRNLLAGAGVLAVSLLLVALVWGRLGQLDREIADLEKTNDALTKSVEEATTLVGYQNEVHDFTDGDVTWLDELHEMARHLPDADKAILDEVTFGAHPQRGGLMTLKGHVTESALIAEFEASLRYNDNVVAGSYGAVDPTRKDYPWLLNTRVAVAPDKRDGGRSQGRPYRAQLEKELATAQAVADQGEPAPGSTPNTKTDSTPEPDSDPAPPPAVETKTETKSNAPESTPNDPTTTSDTE